MIQAFERKSVEIDKVSGHLEAHDVRFSLMIGNRSDGHAFDQHGAVLAKIAAMQDRAFTLQQLGPIDQTFKNVQLALVHAMSQPAL